MDVFSMIKQTITSDDSNPITKYFEIGRQVGSYGPEMVWKIYDAVRKEDKKEASVCIFEKKIADKLHKPRRRETVTEILRQGVQLLEKFKHPRLLGILHPLEESHNSLAFATEPLFASLANVLGRYDRIPTPAPPEIRDHEFLDYEIQYGILQITEALCYLHAVEQMVHKNVCPQSILITKRGTWKLSALCFAETVRDGKDSVICHPWSTKVPKMAQPDLNYIAPETQNSKYCYFLSDMFALGMVICTIFNNGTPLIEAEHNTTTYQKQLDQITEKFSDVAHRMPLPLVEPVEKMINKDIRYRPTAQLFCLLKYFNDPILRSLQQLDNIDILEYCQRAEVYAFIAQVIPSIPKKILYRHVFPALCLECSIADTITSALTPLLTLIDFATREEYVEKILPFFRMIMNSPKPVQATVYILDKLDTVLMKSPADEIRSEVLPFVFNSLESNSLQAQEAALNAIGIIKEYLDDSVMRNMVLPRAKALYHKGSNVRVRLNALSCIDYLLDSLNKMIILDEVLPFLTDITGHDPDIVMAVVGIYKHMLSDKKFGLTHNLIATKVMPPLIPHTVNPGLSMEKFSALMEVLREMLEQIDRKRRNKMQEETSAVPLPKRGSICMPLVDGKTKDDKAGTPSSSRIFLTVENSGMSKSRTEQSLSKLSLIGHDRSREQIAVLTPAAPNSPDLQHVKDDKLSLNPEKESQRRFSLIPPAGGTPGISLISDESPCSDRPRRPSTQSLGQFTLPVSWFGEYRRGSSDSSRRSSTEKPRRPSTHSVGILPISMFGEGGEKPRKTSTHSLGIFPIGGFDDDSYGYSDPRQRRTSAGPFITPEFERKNSRGSLFGFGDPKGGQRRASFQALGESVMQLFSSK
ncbi:SCY1-like protein 2 [Ylistrum balloti]|uniref:SCY1-like protein 2 n=1 Tax=Ylistrum balloti TaxID=509963 RepID=UPI002905F4FA|nr:SCY1-like protein 2 [Ylistrum balloti]